MIGKLFCHLLLFLLSGTCITAVHSSVVCQDRNGCSGNGECVLGVCQCDTGYTGTYCQTIVCRQRDSSDCTNGLVLAACKSLISAGMTVPQACPAVIPGCDTATNSSCQEIHRCFPSAPSGNYLLQLANGAVIEIYCDMEGSNCGGEGGRTRVAFANMTKPGSTCPQGLAQRNYSEQSLCSRNIAKGCQHTTFSAFSLNYNQVCGRLRGYQFGNPDAFAQSITQNTTIDSHYLDGVSITHGSGPRQHIWTYAVGVTTAHTTRFGCPCNTGSTVSPPTFVGGNYYCESAASSSQSGVFFPNDVLWDGEQCTGKEGPCCSDNPNLPWFNTTLPQNSDDDIELRMCGDENSSSEGTPLELIEIYIR